MFRCLINQHHRHVKKKEFIYYYYYVHPPLPLFSMTVASLDVICKIKGIKTILIQIGKGIIKITEKNFLDSRIYKR
ncbi:MAG TPA: hypothetical protein VHJ38_03055 [Nitrososphaeraceae archaeon]|nr:hypothetical protein [Nitrososphaeraceae archaeon]